MNLRNAEIYDVQSLVILCRQLGYETSFEEIKFRLKEIESRLGHDILVVENSDGVVVGWIQVVEVVPLESTAYAEITGLVVDLHVRGSGIGKRLLTAAKSWADSRNLDRVILRSQIKRQRAHNFYEKNQFVKSKTSHMFELVKNT